MIRFKLNWHILFIVLGMSWVVSSMDLSRSTVRVLVNITFMCEQPPPSGRSLPRYQMTNIDLKYMLESQGAHFMTSHMASTRNDARFNFINLIPLPNLIKNTYMRLTGADEIEAEARLSQKETIRNVIRYIKNEYTQEIIPGNTPQPGRQKRSLLKDAKEKKMPETLAENDDAFKIKNPLNEKEKSDLHASYHKWLKEHNLDGWEGYKTATKTSTATGRTGWETNIDFCFPRGSSISGDFLRMCTICSATTVLQASYFPQYINEAMCSPVPTDGHCFFEPSTGTAHGDCFNSTMSLNVLRKKEGTCALALTDGQTVIVDYYELTAIQMYVGCECGMYRHSPLAEYINHPSDTPG